MTNNDVLYKGQYVAHFLEEGVWREQKQKSGRMLRKDGCPWPILMVANSPVHWRHVARAMAEQREAYDEEHDRDIMPLWTPAHEAAAWECNHHCY